MCKFEPLSRISHCVVLCLCSFEKKALRASRTTVYRHRDLLQKGAKRILRECRRFRISQRETLQSKYLCLLRIPFPLPRIIGRDKPEQMSAYFFHDVSANKDVASSIASIARRVVWLKSYHLFIIRKKGEYETLRLSFGSYAQ